MNDWNPSDAELTRIYQQANGELDGKSKPLTTQRIFAAMRAMLSAAPTPPSNADSGVSELVKALENIAQIDTKITTGATAVLIARKTLANYRARKGE